MSRRHRRTPAASLGALAGAEGVDVNDLLRDVSDFRLALDVDLTVAAAAADAVADEAAPAVLPSGLLPSELTGRALDSGLDGVARIRRRSAARIGPPRPPARRRLLTLVPTAPLVLVAVALGLGGGVVASHLTDSPNAPANAADSSLATLSSAIGQGNRAATVAAGHRLQADVAALIKAAPGNAEAARDAATLLLAEQTVIAQLPGAEGDELRAMMAAQSAQLQRVSGSPITTLGDLTTLGRPDIHASSVPSPTSTSLPPAAPHSLLPSAVRSLIPLQPRPSLLAPLTASQSPSASPTATPAAAAPPAAQSATPSATPAPTTTATSTAPTPSPAPSLGLPTSSSFNGLTSPPLIGG